MIRLAQNSDGQRVGELVSPQKGEFNWSFETRGLFIGGTGKFEGFKAIWKVKGKGSGRRKIIGDWEVEYYQ